MSAERPPRWRRLARWIERGLALCGAVFLVFHVGFNTVEITSESMSPTLQGEGGRSGNDWVLFERVSTRWEAPPRGKILVFTTRDGVLIAKRVAAYPGERVEIRKGACFVDGARVELGPAPYLRAGRLREREDGRADHEVSPEGVFVLGDRGNNSWDSRFFGELPRERWKGRAVAIVWPPSRWSWLW